MSIANIQVILTKMTKFLRVGKFDEWALALEKFRNEIVSTPAQTATKILSLYGGMGSLNDLILYANGQPLTSENTELDSLRSELFRLCQEIK
jgi:hypothetical protein